MKKLLQTIASLSTTAVACAGHVNSDLYIRMLNGSPIKVFIDGRAASFRPESYVSIFDLTPGNHTLRVVALRAGYNGLADHLERTIFHGAVFLEEASEIHAEVDRFGRFIVTHVFQRRSPDGHAGQCGYPCCGNARPFDFDHGSDAYSHNQGHGYGYGPAVISDREFSDIRSQVSRAAFESTKLTIAKRAITGRWITADQCLQLMEAFAFESTKVDFAKFAYPMVADKARFYIAYDAFSFSSSIDELDDFIGRIRY
jgi:hypothetical protein